MTRQTVLIFVQISTHFAEMLRVAELLRDSDRYEPIVLFMASYAGCAADMEKCRARSLACIAPDELHRYLPVDKNSASRPARTWSSVFERLARASRRVLLVRGPSLHEWARTSRLPGPLRKAALVLASALSGLVRPLLVLIRPLLRRGALSAFGLVYRRWPRLLPPDTRAQRYVYHLAPALLKALHVKLLVIPEENFYYFTNVFVRAVHEQGGHAVVVPFTVVNVLEWGEAFYRLPSYAARNVVNRITSFLFPRWTHRHKGVSLMMPPQQVLSNEYLDIAPPIPWLINSGYADAIAAESLFMEKHYLAAGIPAHRVRFTGSLADDVLFRQLAAAADTRRRLYVELDLPADRPMILCAPPPNQLAGAGRPDCAFDDYRTLLQAFLRPLDALTDDYNVVIALHPRTTEEEAATITGLRARRSTWNIAELIPLCRLFVASCSATIRMAISCGIPVVNYDVFVFDYDDYTRVPGVATVSGYTAYCDLLNGLARSPEQYDHLQRLQAAFAREETLLDGNAGRRLMDVFDQLSAEDARD